MNGQALTAIRAPGSWDVSQPSDELPPAQFLRDLAHAETIRRLEGQVSALQCERQRLVATLSQLNEQIQVASRVQRELLPAATEFPDLKTHALFQPLERLSGDMYDIHRLDERHLGFSLADASGHGLHAALLHGMLKQAFRSHLVHPRNGCVREPAGVLESVNLDLLAAEFEQGQFVCAAHVLFDRENRTLTYARCGLPYPVLVRRGEPPRQLISQGRILGVFEDVNCESVTVRLEMGDRLLLFTDGLEALLVHGSPDVDHLTETPWFRSLASRSNQAAIADVAQRRQGARDDDWPADDLTLIAIEVTG